MTRRMLRFWHVVTGFLLGCLILLIVALVFGMIWNYAVVAAVTFAQPIDFCQAVALVFVPTLIVWVRFW